MKLSSASLTLASVCFLASPLVIAADTSTVNITGNVIASPCVVDATNSVMTINLDDIQATTLNNDGFGLWKTFAITLTTCPASTTNVEMTLSGTPNPVDPTRYKSTGTATNLSVELTDNAGVNLGNSKKMTVAVNSSTKQAVFNLKTRAFATPGTVMPGTIASSVLATFVYK